MTAQQKLQTSNSNGKYICVGLDTDLAKIPAHLKSLNNPVLEFNKKIIEATKKHTAAYKINLAFYESEGITGLQNLEKTLSLIPGDVLTIADGKRGDIANTTSKYAESIFKYFRFDSATINPLMGKDSLLPFLEFHDKLNFILALTSNPGSEDFQKLKLKDGSFLFQRVIKNVSDWNDNSNCGIVFGATNLTELKNNLSLIGNLPLLIPGVGAQGGSIEDVADILLSDNKNTFLINVSRGIIYKSRGVDFDEQADLEIKSLNKLVMNKKL